MKIIRKNKEIAVFILFLIIGLAIYANSFGNQFFWDDDDVIVNNVYVQNFQLDKFFTQNEIAGAFGQISNYWRPLLLVSFALDYKIWGLVPFGFHLTNTLLHILAAWLVFIFLYQLIELFLARQTAAEEPPPDPSFRRRGALLAFLPALFFLIHPLQTEAVTYVSGRGDPWAAVWSLLTLIFYVVFRNNGRWRFYWGALIFFAAALLVKEQAIYLPLLILLLEAVFYSIDSRKKIIKLIKNVAAFFALAAAYFLARFTFLNFNHFLSGSVNLVNSDYHRSLAQRAYTFCLVSLDYLRLLLVPTGLHMEREITPVEHFWSWPVITFIILVAVAAIVAFKTWRKNRLVAFGLGWFAITLLPHANLVETNRPMYEHWLYLPMVGFWLALFCLIFILAPAESRVADSADLPGFRQSPRGGRLCRSKSIRVWLKRIFCVMLIACVIFFSFLTIRRNRDWHDPITFYEKNLSYVPDSFIERTNLGMAYDAVGRFAEAIVQYRTAIAIADIYPQAHYDLANSLVNVKQYDEAEKEYRRAIEMSPKFGLAYQNLYNLYMYLGEKDKAEKILKEINK
ncbi:MAG: tetratricopeptide repeat protein [Patescibacteria group bacterium]|nr:tetratricopeptide repeat protein [Patescibacteria group bacterium]